MKTGILAVAAIMTFTLFSGLGIGGSDPNGLASTQPGASQPATQTRELDITEIPDREPLPGVKSLVDSSTDVVVSEVVETNPRKAIEGGRDTVILKVIEPLKGGLKKGVSFGVYYHLLWVKTTPPGEVEKPKFIKGEQYIVFVRRIGVHSPGGELITTEYELTDRWVGIVRPHPTLSATIKDMIQNPDKWREIMPEKH